LSDGPRQRRGAGHHRHDRRPLIVGLSDPEIEHLARRGRRGEAVRTRSGGGRAPGADGATTVAATSAIAAAAGIGVFATGGLGGVHREAIVTFDESADLTTLARTPIVVVCAGSSRSSTWARRWNAWRRWASTVAGYRTRRFPGFFVTDGGFDLDWSLDSPAQVAAAHGGPRHTA
jgi:pseudouridine-5'-phosphate glycosidase